MECTRYLPGYYYPKNHNAGLNDIDWNSSRGFNIPLPQFTMNQYQDLVHQKEVLRQKILKHEATFRYQVNELHRVYGRQRELMNELKRRKLTEDHLCLQALESNTFMPQLRSEIFERTYWPIVNLTSIEPFVPSKRIFQESSNSTGKAVQPGGVCFSGQNVSKECNLSLSKSNTSRKRMLDLELPAEDYIDNVEVEPFEEENPVKRPNPQPQCYSKVSFVVTPGDSSTSLSTRRGTPLLFDLNEPAEPAESGCLDSALETENIHKEIRERDQDISETEHAECSKLSKEGKGGNGLNLSDEASSVGRELLPCNQPASLPPENSDKSHAETRTDISLLVSSWRKYKEIPIAVQALPCFTSSVKDNKASDYTSSGKGLDLNLIAPTYLSDYQSASTSTSNMPLNFLEGRNVEIHKSSEVVDSGMVPDCTPESRKCTRNNRILGARVDSKLSTAKICIDLNSCIKEELFSTSPGEATNPTAERHLEGPVSPENKECSPPRGDSEDIIINTSIHLSSHSDPIEELDKVAADILVFISSSVVRRYSKTAIGEPSEASSNCLGWLAAVATSLASNQANEVERPMEVHFEHELLSDRTDCSGAVKLNLRGENIEKKGTALRNHPRRGQARTMNQKDLQTDVAPAVDSLLHPINETIIAPRIGTMRKTPSRTSSRGMRRSNDRERTVSSLLSQHTIDNKHGMTDRFLKGWGLTRRRQKARRAQSSVPPLFS